MHIYAAVVDKETVGTSSNKKEYRYKHSSVPIMFKLTDTNKTKEVIFLFNINNNILLDHLSWY